MPIYVYQCESCGAVEEHIQSMSDAPVTTCGSCGGTLARSMTAASFHLKGGGWYKDGYASTKSGSSSGGDSSAASSSSADKSSSTSTSSSTGA